MTPSRPSWWPAGSGLVDPRAVAVGAVLALAVAVTSIVTAQVIDATVGIDPGSNLVFLFYLVVVGGLVAGGRRAARRRPDAPLAHGALAALAAYAAIAVVSAVIRLATGRSPDAVALVFNALMSATAGIVGGLTVSWRRQ